MQILIFGGSAGGKSGYAGRLAEKLAGDSVIRYIATMPEEGEDARMKIQRHEQLRQKGNYEVRLCLSLSDLDREIRAIKEIKDMGRREDPSSGSAAGTEESAGPVVLLDSLDGLLADVMFGSGGQSGAAEHPADDLLADALRTLAEHAGHLIVVADEYYRDGTEYDAQTEHYIAASGRLLREISKEADAVIEVVFGIPVPVAVKRLRGTNPRRMSGSEVHFRTGGAWYEFFEIPYNDDVDLHAHSHAAD